jgi:hypothetical protein
MEPEDSLPCSQEPSTGPFLSHNNIIYTIPYCLSKIHFNIVTHLIPGLPSGTRDHILLSQIWDFLFVASDDSQGYGGGIRPRLHKGFPLYWFYETF